MRDGDNKYSKDERPIDYVKLLYSVYRQWNECVDTTNSEKNLELNHVAHCVKRYSAIKVKLFRESPNTLVVNIQ